MLCPHSQTRMTLSSQHFVHVYSRTPFVVRQSIQMLRKNISLAETSKQWKSSACVLYGYQLSFQLPSQQRHLAPLPSCFENEKAAHGGPMLHKNLTFACMPTFCNATHPPTHTPRVTLPPPPLNAATHRPTHLTRHPQHHRTQCDVQLTCLSVEVMYVSCVGWGEGRGHVGVAESRVARRLRRRRRTSRQDRCAGEL